MLRLVHVLGGLEVVPQHEVRLPDGTFVARVDVWLNGSTRMPEYDGETHRLKDRHVDDLRREKALRRAGGDRWGYTNREIEHVPEQILRDAEAALGLPHRPDRVDAWWRLARSATVTAAGRRRLAAAIARYRRAALR